MNYVAYVMRDNFEDFFYESLQQAYDVRPVTEEMIRLTLGWSSNPHTYRYATNISLLCYVVVSTAA